MGNQHPLRTYREQRGWNQTALAGFLGVSRATICRWENGGRRVDRELLPKVSEQTGIERARLRPDLAKLFEATG